MQIDLRATYPAARLSLGNLPVDAAESRRASRSDTPARRSERDRFDYWLIFGVSLIVIVWISLLERCNPMFWRSRTAGPERSLWAASKKSAHHFATIAFQG